MYKVICLIMAVLLVLTACGQAQPKETETLPQPAKEKLVPTPMTWEMIDAIPIANADMTQEELRQICVDFFRLQQSIQWTLKEPFSYTIYTYDKYPKLNTETIYAGCPYVCPSTAGNLYRIMDFYDSETGVLDNSQLDDQNFVTLIGNECVTGPFWAWGRVVNSLAIYYNSYMTQAFGCIRVGPYTYDDGITKWSEDHSTKSVCDENGRDIMYESYALLQPADGIYTQWNEPKNSHMRMVSAIPTVVRTETGMIDGRKSYVTYIDQGITWEDYQLDDTVVTVQGDIDVQVTFHNLYNNGYLPFTFAELIGEDPVEPAVITTATPLGDSITQEDFLHIVASCNYAISHCSLELRDANGNITYQKTLYTQTINTRSIATGALIGSTMLQTLLESGPQTAYLTCRVSTGQLMTIYDGAIS